MSDHVSRERQEFLMQEIRTDKESSVDSAYGSDQSCDQTSGPRNWEFTCEPIANVGDDKGPCGGNSYPGQYSEREEEPCENGKSATNEGDVLLQLEIEKSYHLEVSTGEDTEGEDTDSKRRQERLRANASVANNAFSHLEMVRDHLSQVPGGMPFHQQQLFLGLHRNLAEMNTGPATASLATAVDGIRAFAGALHKFTSGDLEKVCSGVLDVVGATIAIGLPQPAGLVAGAIVLLVSNAIMVGGERLRSWWNSGTDSLLSGVEKLLQKHDALAVQQDINGLLELFKSAQSMMNEFHVSALDGSAADMDQINAEVPNNIGVESLGRVAAYLRQAAGSVENAEEAELCLKTVTCYCSLRTYRLLLLKQKQALLLCMDTDQSNTAAKRLQNYVERIELGADRRGDMLFLFRPQTADGAIVAAVYILYDRKKWKLIGQYLDIIGLHMTRPWPYDHQDLQVQGWKDMRLHMKNGHVRGYSLYDKHAFPHKPFFDLKFELFHGNARCDFLPIKKTDNFWLQFTDTHTDEIVYACVDKKTDLLRTTSKKEEALVIRVIMTEDNVCLLAEANAPGRFLVTKSHMLKHHVDVRLKKGKPGPDGHWRLRMRDETNKEVVASEYNSESKIMFLDRLIVRVLLPYVLILEWALKKRITLL